MKGTISVLVLIFVTAVAIQAAPVGTAFTYQGKLSDSTGTPVTGPYDMTFTLFDSDTGGNQSRKNCDDEERRCVCRVVYGTSRLRSKRVCWGCNLAANNRLRRDHFPPLQITSVPYATYARARPPHRAQPVPRPCRGQESRARIWEPFLTCQPSGRQRRTAR